MATPRRLRSLVNEGGNRNRSFAVDLAGRLDGILATLTSTFTVTTRARAPPVRS